MVFNYTNISNLEFAYILTKTRHTTMRKDSMSTFNNQMISRRQKNGIIRDNDKGNGKWNCINT